MIYGKSQSAYCYEGTDILKNRFGTKNQKELDILEHEYSDYRVAQILSLDTLEITGFGINTLSRIHRHLFSDVYDWAGKPRTEDIAKGGMAFMHFEDIVSAARSIKPYIEERNDFKGLESGEFIRQIANVHSFLNTVHLFREGNGRTNRTFLKLLARSAGYEIHYSDYPKDLQLEADRLSMQEDDNTGLALMYANIIDDYHGSQRIIFKENPRPFRIQMEDGGIIGPMTKKALESEIRKTIGNIGKDDTKDLP